MTQKNYTYKAFGLVISSEIMLPGMIETEEEPDIFIRFGKLPEATNEPFKKGVLYSISQYGFKLSIPDIANVYCVNQKEITVEVINPEKIDDIPVFLSGSLMGYLLHYRDFLPIHGSSLRKRDKTIIFTGISGAGKSTLAAHFCKRGWKLISDDISSIQQIDNKPFIYPGTYNLKLWQDALKALKYDLQGDKVRPDLEKYYLSHLENFLTKGDFAHAIFLLTSHNKETIEIDEIKGVEKFELLRKNTYRPQYVSGTLREPVWFELLGDLSSRIKLYRVTRPSFLYPFAELRKKIEHVLFSS